VLIVGDRGCGKSALVKTVFGTRLRRRANRRAAVLSAARGHAGEYGRLCQVAGVRPVAFCPAGAVRLNPLDPRITWHDRDALVRTIL